MDASKMTGAEIAVYVRNQLLSLTELARANGIRIDMYAPPQPDGLSYASFGDYMVTCDAKNGVRYIDDHIRQITPEQVRLKRPRRGM